MRREWPPPRAASRAPPWLPGWWRYRPGGPPTEPALREAWNLGRTQQPGVPACPTPEQMRRFQRLSSRERDAYVAGVRAGRGEPTAPLRFHIAAIFIGIEAVGQALAGDRIPAVIAAMPAAASIAHLRTELEQRRARELGLTAESAPQLRVNWEQMLLLFLWSAYVRLRGTKPATPSWERTFARSLVSELDRHRAWQRALDRSV